MTHKKIIKRENGNTVEIKVSFFKFVSKVDHLGKTFWYDVNVLVKEKRKRTWKYYNTAATPEEIHAAKLELWELLKPIK